MFAFLKIGSSFKNKSSRRISKRRLSRRRVRISTWARRAENCEKSIAEIDNKISKLKGSFIRAQKEYLRSRRAILSGQLNEAETHLNVSKDSLSKAVKHNENLVKRRFS